MPPIRIARPKVLKIELPRDTPMLLEGFSVCLENLDAEYDILTKIRLDISVLTRILKITDQRIRLPFPLLERRNSLR